MEEIFNQYKGMIITHKNYKGVLCGYNDEHFILAVDNHPDISFRKLSKTSIIVLEQYKDSKYRYIYEDESVIIKQHNEQRNKKG